LQKTKSFHYENNETFTPPYISTSHHTHPHPQTHTPLSLNLNLLHTHTPLNLNLNLNLLPHTPLNLNLNPNLLNLNLNLNLNPLNLRSMVMIAYDPIYAHPLPEGHRFPMLKYELIPEQLLHEGSITHQNIFTPAPCDEEIILWTHDAQYWHDLKNLNLTAAHIRRIGFPLSAQLVEREIRITRGTIDCCHYALQFGVALNVAGGTHHAFSDRGEGFCLLNDMAVAANYLLKKELARQIAIIDLDVHQGNGTAKIFENEKRVFTFSMHGGHNYPFIKEKSDLDVPLPNGMEDAGYLSLLHMHLDWIEKHIKPDFIFFLSGVDILATDKYGKLKITVAGCRRRDEMVFDWCKKMNLPCVVAMGGGYSPDVRHIVEAHCNTFRAAVQRWG
jgi:acetoin utilization deacetylase AcuC-like enzyme